MKIILLPGESIYAVLNGQVARICAGPASLITPDPDEEELCDCLDDSEEATDEPNLDEDGFCLDCGCLLASDDEEDGCEDSVEEDDQFDEESWSLGYDQGFEDGLDFSDQSDEGGTDECCPTDTTPQKPTDCPCCDFFEATDYASYTDSSHSHKSDCPASHEVN